jgi:hypothetical protein
MELDLRHHPPSHSPTRRLIKKTLVPHHRLVAWPSHGPRQQFRNVPLQIVVGRKADRVLRVLLFQRLVELRLGKGGVGAENHFLAQPLLAFNLGQQKFFPALGSSSQPSALWTLPGRNFAVKQSPSRLNSSSG